MTSQITPYRCWWIDYHESLCALVKSVSDGTFIVTELTVTGGNTTKYELKEVQDE